jgi:hypothetical protein
MWSVNFCRGSELTGVAVAYSGVGILQRRFR